MSSLRNLRPTLSCLLALLVSTPAAWSASPLIDARLSVALIQYNGQSEVTAPANGAKPGDVLEYTARYTNRGTAAADAWSPTMPIPAGTEYLPIETAPRPTHASLDGSTFAAIPIRRPVRGPDGAIHDFDVPTREYRALRWTVGTLAAGSEVTVRARVRVEPPTSQAR